MKHLKKYILPYLVLLTLAVIEVLLPSKNLPTVKENFSYVKDPKHYQKGIYYLRKPLILFNAKNILLPRLTTLNDPNVDEITLKKNDLQIKVLPKGESIIIYTKLAYQNEFIFEYKGVRGVLGSSNQKEFDSDFSIQSLRREITEDIDPLIQSIRQKKSFNLNLCENFYDHAFSESTHEAPKHALMRIAERNLYYLKYRIVHKHWDQKVRITKSVLKEKGEEKKQCYTVATDDLRYYFLAYTLLRS